jgi:hypothetical protein
MAFYESLESEYTFFPCKKLQNSNKIQLFLLFRLDLNQKRLQHKKEKIQFLEHQKAQARKLFAIPVSQSQSKTSQGPTTTTTVSQQEPQQPQIFIPTTLEAMNNLIGFPSFESLGTHSTFNMSSVSQQPPYFPPPVNMDLIAKVQELTAQNNQLMGNNYKALDTITQLVESFNLMAYSMKFWSGNIAAQQVTPQPEPQPPVYKEPPIAKIPVKAPSLSSSDGVNGISSKNNRRGKKKVPKIRIENVILAGKAVTSKMINGKKPEAVVPIFDDTSEDDDAMGGADENWFIPNPPPEISQQWHMLRRQYNANDLDTFHMSNEEIQENLLFRIVSHCGNFLPPWIFRSFRDSVTELFDELYTEDEHRSETLSELHLFPDTEPMEAAVEKKLYDYIWPIICKAIRKTSQEMYLNSDIFGTDTTEWITTEEELEHFRTLMNDDDISSSSSDASMEMDEMLYQSNHQQQQRQPPDLQALAQERIDEVSEEEY